MPELGFYTIKEVADYLRLSVRGVKDLISRGELKACKFSERRTRIDQADLFEFIRRSKQQNDPAVERAKLVIPE